MTMAHDERIATDPPVSEAQRRAMYAAREGKSTLGIPKKVGEEFVGKDMKPDDWRGLIRGLIKFFMEERREDEHAEDEQAHDSLLAGVLPPAEVKVRIRDAHKNEICVAQSGITINDGTLSSTDVRFAMDRDLYDADGKRIVAADRLALDRSASVRTYDMDGQLHISRTPVSKANIGEYYGAEIPSSEELGLDPKRKYKLLRDPVELKKGADSSNGKQVLIKHVPVSADDHQPDITVGALGTDAEYVDPYLYNSMTIHAREGIKGIEDDTRREISMAYHYVPVMEPGMYKGEPYDGRMTDIVFNHGCLVEAGRAGADVLVMDSASNDAAWAALEAALQII